MEIWQHVWPAKEADGLAFDSLAEYLLVLNFFDMARAVSVVEAMPVVLYQRSSGYSPKCLRAYEGGVGVAQKKKKGGGARDTSYLTLNREIVCLHYSRSSGRRNFCS